MAEATNKIENTFYALCDVQEILCDKSLDELSDPEQQFAVKLIGLCKEIVNDFGIEADMLSALQQNNRRLSNKS